MTNLLTPPYAALIALLPATLAAFWGYRLARFADDPVLPERLLMMRNRNGAAIGEIAIGKKVVATATSIEKGATVRIYSRP